MSLYQTSASYLSVKHSPSAIAFCTTALSSGSFWPSANVTPGAASTSARVNNERAGRGIMPRRLSGGAPSAQELDHAVDRHVLRFGVAPVPVFELARVEPALRDHDAMRNAEELRVGELHSGPRVAIVEQRLETRGAQRFVQLLGRLAHARGFLQVDGHQHHLEGRDRLRPDDAALVVVLLDRGRHHARHADAVATHEHGDLATLLVHHFGVHRVAVFPAELEHVTDLDAAREAQRAAPVGRWIA